MITRKFPWLLICGVSVFSFVWVYRRGIDINWDLRNYHYFFGYSLVHWRFDADIAPAGLHSFFNSMPCAALYLLLCWLPFPGSAWAITALQLLSLPILVLICKEVDRELGNQTPSLAALLALSLCLAAPLWWSELGTTFFSSTTAPLVLLGLLLGMRGLRKASELQPAATSFVWSGVAIGFASGLKLTNSVFAVGLLFALAMVLFPVQTRLAGRLLLFYVLGLAVGFAPTSWWNIFLFERWDSPLFPYYNAIFRSPYYEVNNFRDLRYKFDSLWELVRFLFAATLGTKKTAEFVFADARMLIFATLMLVSIAAWCWKRLEAGQKLTPAPTTLVTRAFLWFLSLSFGLWALMFAYQRYLIPIELLFGMGVWIFASQIFKTQGRIVAAMTICLVVSLATLEVPDWGHLPNQPGRRTFPEVKVSDDLASTPADYLVYGQATSYVLPFLHPNSRFFGIGFIPNIDKLVVAALANDRFRPIRLLTFEDDLSGLTARLTGFGLVREEGCWHFHSDVDRFVACKVRISTPKNNPDPSFNR